MPWGTGSSLSSDAPAPRTQTDSHVPDPESVLNSENWLEIKPEEGASYFWNGRAGISAKRLPQGVQCSWSLHHSAEGKPYFHNRSSGSTVWDLPSFPQGERGAGSCVYASGERSKWIESGAALSVAGLQKGCRYNKQVAEVIGFQDGHVFCKLPDLDLKSSPSELQWGADKQYLFIDSQGHHRKYCLRLPLDFERKQQEAQRGHEVAPTWPLLVFLNHSGGRHFFARAKKLLSSEGFELAASRFAVLSPLVRLELAGHGANAYCRLFLCGLLILFWQHAN